MSAAMVTSLRAAIAAARFDDEPPADPVDAADYLRLLTTLYNVGRGDVPLGRLFEGHVDATQIVRRYANADQWRAFAGQLARGATIGVWNAALPDVPMTLHGTTMAGGKSYASGAGVLTHALVTADTDAGVQLLLIDLTAHAPEVDRDWWRTIGMQRSETHRVRWRASELHPSAMIGAPSDYVREPYFSGGALRFVAVQAGAVAGLLDAVAAHLNARGRASDPVQATRLARLYSLADAAAGAVRGAAIRWFDDEGATIARVAAARTTVAAAADEALTLAQQAVGLEGMFVDHPLSAMVTDLTVYLRQPAPDAARLRVAQAVADGSLTVGL